MLSTFQRSGISAICRQTTPHVIRACSYTRQPPLLRLCSCRRLTVYAVKNTSRPLPGVSPAHKEDVVRILEKAEGSLDTWSTTYTDFYAPPVVAEAMVALQKTAICAIAWGGFAQAERRRIAFLREEVKEAMGDAPKQVGGVAALRVKGNFIFDKASHRDMLGACLGTGIDRSKVGDVLLLGEQGAHILVVPELAEYLTMNLTSVRTVPVEVQEVPLDDLQISEPRTQILRSVEASLRLDAVASAGFRISRSKMLTLIKAGDVRLNWAPAKANDAVAAGDVISCSGKGRVEVKDASLTKKGRHAIELHRLL